VAETIIAPERAAALAGVRTAEFMGELGARYQIRTSGNRLVKMEDLLVP
jgi:hypothetical protein